MKIDTLFGVAGKVAAITGGGQRLWSCRRPRAGDQRRRCDADRRQRRCAGGGRKGPGGGGTFGRDRRCRRYRQSRDRGGDRRGGRTGRAHRHSLRQRRDFRRARLSGDGWRAQPGDPDRKPVERTLGQGLGHQRDGDCQDGPGGGPAYETTGRGPGLSSPAPVRRQRRKFSSVPAMSFPRPRWAISYVNSPTNWPPSTLPSTRYLRVRRRPILPAGG